MRGRDGGDQSGAGQWCPTLALVCRNVQFCHPPPPVGKACGPLVVRVWHACGALVTRLWHGCGALLTRWRAAWCLLEASGRPKATKKL